MSASSFTKMLQCQHIREPKDQMVQESRPLSGFACSLLQLPTAGAGASQLFAVHLSKHNWSARYYYLQVKMNYELLKFMKWNLKCFSLGLLDEAPSCVDPTQTVFQLVVYKTIFSFLYFLSRAAVCSPSSNELGSHLLLIEVHNKTSLSMRG